MCLKVTYLLLLVAVISVTQQFLHFHLEFFFLTIHSGMVRDVEEPVLVAGSTILRGSLVSNFLNRLLMMIIELRICADAGSDDEDFPLELLEFYVQ